MDTTTTQQQKDDRRKQEGGRRDQGAGQDLAAGLDKGHRDEDADQPGQWAEGGRQDQPWKRGRPHRPEPRFELLLKFISPPQAVVGVMQGPATLPAPALGPAPTHVAMMPNPGGTLIFLSRLEAEGTHGPVDRESGQGNRRRATVETDAEVAGRRNARTTNRPPRCR